MSLREKKVYAMQASDRCFEVVVPCSTANLGPGFDSIGMALNRFLRLKYSPSPQLKIELLGDHLAGISPGEDNLIVQVMKKAFSKQSVSLPPFHLAVESEIPLTRGLGSSAAAIVGGLAAANHLLGEPWDKKELLQIAMEWEGHPDNIGASLYGGVVIGSWDGREVDLVQCEPPDLPIVAVIPVNPLSTRMAREVLPDLYPRREAILSSSRANLLVAALLTRRWDLLQTAMKDSFHQPYREALVPGLKEVLKEAHHHGALGVALSGAGPTILSFTFEQERIKAYFREKMKELALPAEVVELRASREGAIIQLTPGANRSKVLGNIKGVRV
ncbi:homoserine kinase [Paenactinomyces guangxiensis]|uniref:Homoserine kinase n=1 Tax=Paenactinomyces guangxiensis TaxID=1490290 RepID=A0A7W1WUA3_9BACL|nr:homoserine kinase [Paenactinomyces guangxiensis]MBA4496176.1 homoserine kinase [Paenactinomyces guangxiensis]MBH8593265.1 homoserine kinase [Paenactinomyces guangxiensis]